MVKEKKDNLDLEKPYNRTDLRVMFDVLKAYRCRWKVAKCSEKHFAELIMPEFRNRSE